MALPPDLMGHRALDRDKLSMVARDAAARAGHLALFQLQDIESPEEQALGVGVLFAAMCLACGLDPSDLHGMGKRVILASAEGDAPTDNALQSLRDFIGARVMAREVVIG
jgi:hypothetical protein